MSALSIGRSCSCAAFQILSADEICILPQNARFLGVLFTYHLTVILGVLGNPAAGAENRFEITNQLETSAGPEPLKFFCILSC